MRIISGLYKGRKIVAPKNLPVRPTTDMSKEALFNILNNQYYFDDISVLDLFSGTGNISYEFASRGTENITAVDSHYDCIKFISQTAESFEMLLQTIKSDVFKFLETNKNKYDIIFAAPPYDFDKETFSKIFTLDAFILFRDFLQVLGNFSLLYIRIQRSNNFEKVCIFLHFFRPHKVIKRK